MRSTCHFCVCYEVYRQYYRKKQYVEKTWLPHTQYQTYDFTRNGLLAQYTIVFHCWPCSKATSLVSVAAFLRPSVSLEWHLEPLDGRGSLVLVLGGLSKPRRARQCLLSSIWSAVSTRKVQ